MLKHNSIQKYFLATLLVFLCAIQTAVAATDAQIIKDAHWETHQIVDGITLKQAQFSSLFGAAQSVNILEVDLNPANIQEKNLITTASAKVANAILAHVNS